MNKAPKFIIFHVLSENHNHNSGTKSLFIGVMKDRQRGMTYGEISKKYNIPRPSIQRIIGNYPNTNKKRGPKEKLTKNDKRRIKTVIAGQYERNAKCSINDIIRDCHINVSKATVCRTLKCLNFKYERLNRKFQDV